MTEMISKTVLHRWAQFQIDKYMKSEDLFDAGMFTSAINLKIDLENGWLDDEESLRYRGELCANIDCHHCYGQACEHSR